MPRRIKKANIAFISLVPAGANKLHAVYKDDGSVELSTLLKLGTSFDEQGELTAVVYAPNQRDSQGDIADEAVVKQMAYDFIANGGKVDIRHDGKPVGPERARVAETFLVQKTDTRFHGWKDREGNAVDLTGAWATVIKIEDPELRKKYRSGEWAGVSMGGTAIVEQEKADLEPLLKALLEKISPPNPPKKEETMDEAKLLKAITDGFSTLTTELTKALKPEPAKKEETKGEPEDKPPAFRGDVTNARDVQKHARALELYSLKKGTNWSDPDSVRDYSAAVAVKKAEWKAEDEADGITDDEKPVRKSSVRDVVNVNLAPAMAGISKADQDLLQAGRLIAEARNAERSGAKK